MAEVHQPTNRPPLSPEEAEANRRQTWDNLLDAHLLIEQGQELQRRVNRRLAATAILLVVAVAVFVANVYVRWLS